MSFTVFLGNLPTWVTADDIMGWFTAENPVADAIKVIRNPETQESKGFAFIDAPKHGGDELRSSAGSIAHPWKDRLLRANPAQPPRPKGQGPAGPPPGQGMASGRPYTGPPPARCERERQGQRQGATAAAAVDQRPPRRGKKSIGGGARRNEGPPSPFAEELTNALN